MVCKDGCYIVISACRYRYNRHFTAQRATTPEVAWYTAAGAVFVLKMMEFGLKMMEFGLKMMGFAAL